MPPSTWPGLGCLWATSILTLLWTIGCGAPSGSERPRRAPRCDARRCGDASHGMPWLRRSDRRPAIPGPAVRFIIKYILNVLYVVPIDRLDLRICIWNTWYIYYKTIFRYMQPALSPLSLTVRLLIPEYASNRWKHREHEIGGTGTLIYGPCLTMMRCAHE